MEIYTQKIEVSKIWKLTKETPIYFMYRKMELPFLIELLGFRYISSYNDPELKEVYFLGKEIYSNKKDIIESIHKKNDL